MTPDKNLSIRVDSDQAKPITQPETYLNTFWGSLFELNPILDGKKLNKWQDFRFFGYHNAKFLLIVLPERKSIFTT